MNKHNPSRVIAPSQSSSRRNFIAGAFRYTSALGMPIVFSKCMPLGLSPIAMAENFFVQGKHPELTLLNERPLSLETPAHLLDDQITPVDRLFVRNNGLPPENIEVQKWQLAIDGEGVERAKIYSIEELKKNFENVSYQLTLECAGNGREEFSPPARGNQWSTGAIGCPSWTGIRLRDLLLASGIKDDAIYIGYYGADRHLSGDPSKDPISRGVPLSKAMQEDSILAFSINGSDLPVVHGYPIRLVFGGWPGSTSGKWLKRISVRNQIHDGAKMGGYSYRIPCRGVAPGSTVLETNMCIIEAMPVKSLVTFPKSGVIHKFDTPINVRGHAWVGDSSVSEVHLSIDFGQTWLNAELDPAVNKNAWQHWRKSIHFPRRGYYEVWSRATDRTGRMQPMVLPGWNPRGYLNNACHRIAVRVV